MCFFRRMGVIGLAVLPVLNLTIWAFAREDYPFPDVDEEAAYAEALLELYNEDILKGDDKGNFNPNNTITRAEFAAIVCRLLGAEEEVVAMRTSVFNDVPASHWAVGYVAKAAELGIINGYGDGRFGPGDPVTVEQAAKMLVCAWGYGDAGE